MPVILGVAVLILLLWAASAFSKADPKQAARLLRAIGGGGAAAVRRLSAFSRSRSASPSRSERSGSDCSAGYRCGRQVSAGARRNLPGQASRVRSAFLEMELDHDSGAMRGRILAGRYEGTALDALDVPTLVGLIG